MRARTSARLAVELAVAAALVVGIVVGVHGQARASHDARAEDWLLTSTEEQWPQDRRTGSWRTRAGTYHYVWYARPELVGTTLDRQHRRGVYRVRKDCVVRVTNPSGRRAVNPTVVCGHPGMWGPGRVWMHARP